MKDYQRHLEKLRKDAAECALVRDLATDKAKREMFARLALHLNQLADEVEQAARASKTSRGGSPVGKLLANGGGRVSDLVDDPLQFFLRYPEFADPIFHFPTFVHVDLAAVG
jgi:hypothetical protein